MTFPDLSKVLIGPDVSNVNGKALDPAELKRQRMGFGIYKIGQGLIEDNKAFLPSGLDRLAKANDDALIAAGLPRCRYFFLQDDDGAEQADRALKLSQILGAPERVGHAVDVEVQDSRGRHPSLQTIKDFEARWRVIAPRLRLGLYSGRWFWRGYIGDPPLPPFDWLWDGGTYVADENSTADPWQVLQSGGRDKEGVTPGYWNRFGGRERYDLRQYKSTCEIGGIHPCDVSVFPGAREALESLWGITAGASPTPSSTPPAQHPYPPYPGRPLRLGDPRNSAVMSWQARMRERGWRIAVDGVFGPETERVCRQFQIEKRLVVDGIVGPMTWAAAWTSPVT